MKKVNRLYQLLPLLTRPTDEETAVVPYAPLPLRQQQPNPVRPVEPTIIDIPYEADLPLITNPFQELASYIREGCRYHPICRNAFIELVQHGYWRYERRTKWHTCTLASAYAGAFGPTSIERPEFSYSMAIWKLSQKLGLNIGTYLVTGPTNRKQNLADEMIELTDTNLWTREGVADWLETVSVRGFNSTNW